MSDTRFIFATALLSSVCFSAQALALTMSDVAASNLIHTDTYTSTPSAEPAASFAQLDKTYKLAGVCFLGHGDCGGAGGGEYDSFGEGLDVPGSYLCQNAGYKTCSAGQIGNPATVCPDDENYFKECKCNYAEMTPGTYNNNCGPLATVSTCKDTTGDYYLCSCASDSMTRCNQSNELLLDKSQYCQNPKEGTRWYGKGACLVCTAPKVPNSSTKTCSCPTNYKVCTSPSVGVGAGCEDNGVMKYASCECPSDYVTCRWGPAAGSASCNTGSGLRYQSCKPDPKTCEEWMEYVYGASYRETCILEDTVIDTLNIGNTETIRGIDYASSGGLCNGRSKPNVTVNNLIRQGGSGWSTPSLYIDYINKMTIKNINLTKDINIRLNNSDVVIDSDINLLAGLVIDGKETDTLTINGNINMANNSKAKLVVMSDLNFYTKDINLSNSNSLHLNYDKGIKKLGMINFSGCTLELYIFAPSDFPATIKGMNLMRYADKSRCSSISTFIFNEIILYNTNVTENGITIDYNPESAYYRVKSYPFKTDFSSVNLNNQPIKLGGEIINDWGSIKNLSKLELTSRIYGGSTSGNAQIQFNGSLGKGEGLRGLYINGEYCTHIFGQKLPIYTETKTFTSGSDFVSTSGSPYFSCVPQ